MTDVRVRPAAVAGTFYPANPDELRAALHRAFAAAAPHGDAGDRAPKALIAPHAGYVYSGPVAASAYIRLAPARDRIRKVVLVGPSHRVALRGLAVSSADAFATPLGPVTVDAGGRELLRGMVQVDDRAHAHEHSIEVHLPFLQHVLDGFSVLPLVVGSATAADVAAVLDVVWGDDDTAVVVSTDLSHYHDHDTATRLDQATAAAIEARDDERIADTDACGAVGVRGLLVAAASRGLRVRTIDRRTSADTAGSPDRVVGYGAFVVG